MTHQIRCTILRNKSLAASVPWDEWKKKTRIEALLDQQSSKVNRVRARAGRYRCEVVSRVTLSLIAWTTFSLPTKPIFTCMGMWTFRTAASGHYVERRDGVERPLRSQKATVVPSALHFDVCLEGICTGRPRSAESEAESESEFVGVGSFVWSRQNYTDSDSGWQALVSLAC